MNALPLVILNTNGAAGVRQRRVDAERATDAAPAALIRIQAKRGVPKYRKCRVGASNGGSGVIYRRRRQK